MLVSACALRLSMRMEWEPTVRGRRVHPFRSHEMLSIHTEVPSPAVENVYSPCVVTWIDPDMRADHEPVPVGEVAQLTVSDGTTRPSILGPSSELTEPPRKSAFPK